MHSSDIPPKTEWDDLRR